MHDNTTMSGQVEARAWVPDLDVPEPRMTLPRMVEEAAMSSTSITIVRRDGRTSRSRADLLSDAARVAGGLKGRGILKGDRIALRAVTRWDFILGCLAVWRMGAVVVPVSPDFDLSLAGTHSEMSDPLTAAGVKAFLAEEDQSVPAGLAVHLFAELKAADPYDGPGPEPDDEALIQWSSGTTGVAKGVLLTHRALASYVIARESRLVEFRPQGSSSVSWLPLHHDLGFINYLIEPLCAGDPLVLMAPGHFMRDPLAWLREIESSAAANSSAPNSAFGLTASRLERWTGPSFDLSSLKVATVGGEPVDADVLKRFATAARPHGFDLDSFKPGYGLAEATCGVTIASGVTTDQVLRDPLARGEAVPSSGGSATATFVSVGSALPGTEIKIVDPEGGTRSPREIGEVIVRSTSLMKGYVPDGAGHVIGADGWLHTGDLGYVADDELFITGRIKDLIIIRGRNHHAEEIERIASGVEGVRPGRCAAFPGKRSYGTDQLVVVVEAKVDPVVSSEEIAAGVRRAVYSGCGVVVQEVVVVPPGSIPKTTSGKIQRKRMRDLYLQGIDGRTGG